MVQLKVTLTNVFEGEPLIAVIIRKTKQELKDSLSDTIMKTCISKNVFGTFLLEEDYEEDGEYLDRDETMINVISPKQVAKERSDRTIFGKELQMIDNVLCHSMG